MTLEACPFCGNPDLDQDEVDVGVGTYYGLPGCGACESYEIELEARDRLATEEERRLGWQRGDHVDEARAARQKN